MNSQNSVKTTDSIRPIKGRSLFSCKEGQRLTSTFDIDDLIRGQNLKPNESIAILGETAKHQFILYKTMKSDGGFVLKRKKGTSHLRYFRQGLTLNCIYMNHLIQADASDYSNNMAVFTTNLITRKTKRYNWFSKNDRRVADFGRCCDVIKGITVNSDGKLDLLVHRYETADPSYDAEHNYEMDYHLIVAYRGNTFQATALYPPRPESNYQRNDNDMEDSTHNQQNTALLLTRLMQHCGCNFEKPSMADRIVSIVIILPMKYKNKFPFTNRFVLADAALLGMLYAISTKSDDFVDDEEFDAFVEECMEKTYRGIMEMYGVDRQSLLSISDNRINYFQPILADGINDDDMDHFYEEASMLFEHDIVNNQFIQFGKDVPLPLFDVNQQTQIEVETIAHFSTLFKMVDRIDDLV